MSQNQPVSKLDSDLTQRRISSGLKKIEQALVEWRSGEAYGELGITFVFDRGQVKAVRQTSSKMEK